jgi:prepilin-type N-terminal cleavage/methylation domain-containing protein/prepilin-type processing-associated H-X9-DG protein
MRDGAWKDRSRHSYGRHCAFTLVELLVVVGIIAVLIGILLPIVAKARDAALTAQCASNMRQDGVAVNQYLSESNGFLPPYRVTAQYAYGTHPYIFQYLPALYLAENAKTWVCPADNLVESVEGGNRGPYPELNSGTLDIYYSYALNYDEPLSQSLLYPATNSLYFNPGLGMKVRTSSSFMFLHETGESAAQEYNSLPGSFRFNHRGNTAMNLLFMDGHVDSLTASEMLPASQWTSSKRAFWFGSDGAPDQMLF